VRLPWLPDIQGIASERVAVLRERKSQRISPTEGLHLPELFCVEEQQVDRPVLLFDWKIGLTNKILSFDVSVFHLFFGILMGLEYVESGRKRLI